MRRRCGWCCGRKEHCSSPLAGDGDLLDAIAGKPGSYRVRLCQVLRKTKTRPMMINPIPSRLNIASLLPKIR